MATQFSMLQIINAALIAQGQYEISSENDGSDEWRLLSRNWPQIVEAEMEAGNYHFTKTQTQLLSQNPGKFGFEYAYTVPAAALHVRNAWITNNLSERIQIDWVQDGSAIHTDEADGCWIEYVIAPDASFWTATFALGVQYKLEALICRAIKEEATEARQMEELAEATFQKSRTTSSKARRAQPAYRIGPIASARFARGTT
jgi:hypothetical protein